MAYVVMAYVVMACIVMAYVVMACIVMAYVVMASRWIGDEGAAKAYCEGTRRRE